MEDWSHHAAAVLRAAEVQTFAERCSCLRLLRLDAGLILGPNHKIRGKSRHLMLAIISAFWGLESSRPCDACGALGSAMASAC